MTMMSGIRGVDEEPTSDTLGLINKTRTRALPMLEEKDKKNYRLWGFAVLGLLLGLTVYSTVVGGIAGQALFGGAGGGWYFVTVGIIATFVYAIGAVGTYGMYQRILGCYGMSVMLMAALMFVGFITVLVSVATVGEEDFVKKCFDTIEYTYETQVKVAKEGSESQAVPICSACCSDIPTESPHRSRVYYTAIRQYVESLDGYAGFDLNSHDFSPTGRFHCFCDGTLAMIGDKDAFNYANQTYFHFHQKNDPHHHDNSKHNKTGGAAAVPSPPGLDEPPPATSTWPPPASPTTSPPGGHGRRLLLTADDDKKNVTGVAVNKTWESEICGMGASATSQQQVAWFLPTQCSTYYALLRGPVLAMSFFGLVIGLLMLASTVLSYRLANMPGMV